MILVTGGNSGIGLECVRALAARGKKVLIAARNRDASMALAAELNAAHGEGTVTEMGLDLGSLANVRAFAGEIERRDLAIDTLVCNAGLQVSGGPKKSTDGFELSFAVNHLGHFLLTNLMLSRLAARAPARVVVVASGVHDPALRTGMPNPSWSDFETLARTGAPDSSRYNDRLAYVNSKLCNLWFAYELARRIEAAGLATVDKPISVNGFEPGLVPGSGLAREYPPVLRAIWEKALPAVAGALTRFVPGISTTRKSGAALARVVLNPELKTVSGNYYPSHTRWRLARSSADSYDTELAAQLWQASVEFSGLQPQETPFEHAA